MYIRSSLCNLDEPCGLDFKEVILMAEKELEQTQKALTELVKTEYQAIAAYDEALGETEDSKLRRQYTRFRNDHEKQARALNNRLAELGGEPVEYDGAKFGR